MKLSTDPANANPMPTKGTALLRNKSAGADVWCTDFVTVDGAFLATFDSLMSIVKSLPKVKLRATDYHSPSFAQRHC